MKIIDFGSLNIDKVYNVKDFVNGGQTIFAAGYGIFPGGKGLNQSIAAARAGACVIHAGCIGEDGEFLRELLAEAGVDTSSMKKLDAPTGHAIIEVDHTGQNRIIVYGGTNQMLTREYIDSVLSKAEKGDVVLLQNETNLIGYIIEKAHGLGIAVAFNPSPMPEDLCSIPLEYVDYFMVNEIEAAQLAGAEGTASFEEILDMLSSKYPGAAIIMTLGNNGVLYRKEAAVYSHPCFKVTAKDTTAAGDTFSGYFLSAVLRGADIPTALKEASAAAAIAVSREGASPSIPVYEEVREFLASGGSK